MSPCNFYLLSPLRILFKETFNQFLLDEYTPVSTGVLLKIETLVLRSVNFRSVYSTPYTEFRSFRVLIASRLLESTYNNSRTKKRTTRSMSTPFQ